MKKERILVTGKYKNDSTYVLYKKNGRVLRTIREGKKFKIGRKSDYWIPIKFNEYDGFPSIMVCYQFDSNGNVLKKFPLINNKIGLWAVSDRLSSKEVFISYFDTKFALDSTLFKLGYDYKNLERLSEIDLLIELEGDDILIISNPEVSNEYGKWIYVKNASFVIVLSKYGEYSKLTKLYLSNDADMNEVFFELFNHAKLTNFYA